MVIPLSAELLGLIEMTSVRAPGTSILMMVLLLHDATAALACYPPK